jgi:hypothetical protein
VLQWQPLAQRGLVHLHDAAARGLQRSNLLAQRQRQLRGWMGVDGEVRLGDPGWLDWAATAWTLCISFLAESSHAVKADSILWRGNLPPLASATTKPTATHLEGLRAAGQVLAGEGPVEDGHGARQHALDRAGRQVLGGR